MKRLIFLSFIILASCALLFGCGDTDGTNGSDSSSTTESTHYHVFDKTTWVTSEQGHYNPCTCHPEAYVMKDHVDNLDWNGVCDVCQYVLRAADVYTLTVLDDAGNPVEGAVFVLRSNYDVTVTTDKDGRASVEFTDVSGVNAVVETLPAGYTAEKNIFPFPTKSYELTITLTKVASPQ